MTPASILTLDGVAYALPDGRPLFTDLNERFDQRRTGLVGRNGVGKSILAHILCGRLAPTSGHCRAAGRVHYLGQHLGGPATTVRQLAQVDAVLDALQRIEAGSCSQADFDTVGERWDMRERLQAQLARHGLEQLDAERPVATLSGGQAMRVALLGAFLSEADYLILDEPSNHLDGPGRAQLLTLLGEWNKGLLVISHDRELLEHMERIVELSTLGLASYGGNYSVYAQCKAEESAQAERTLERLKLERQRQARALQQQRERLERRQSRAGREARDSNQAKILLDRKQERSEATAGKQQRDHQAARQAMAQKIRDAAQRVEAGSAIVLHAPAPTRQAGNPLVTLQAVQLPFGDPLQAPLDACLYSGERVALVGANGSGKSTLLSVLAGHLAPRGGHVQVCVATAYVDQQCSLLPSSQSVLDYLRQCTASLDESSLRTRLAQLGLGADRVELPSGVLSGGERLKAALAGVLYGDNPVQLLLLDEPSNHLDLPSLTALETMLRHYRGALLVASHDSVFLQQVGLDREWRVGR
ncbi:ABC-F family ATP-binding cassette domain-containing protein [Pseudomonas sp. JQ170]|uniref:ABC-F family ATP-binding cassette domain-containing protein n=1 Tax=unclassified Pseudomonas TaxID=196821 RepID=UPI00264ACC3F|nr:MULTISPECIES: ABC-F family ATP-binding cassette domain-containing protein [unclassified Pseudomonas]MDN7143027.1 ABC-F family ATP-binding cassette domain-containing protein [Pseudomonas sp. JQ170]WRO74478.1 ABC-F family ATP-binding cassette domain-containing protein [Pseudomonas sp. 170C]